MIDGIYDKTSKISFSTYGDDFLRYFGEYRRIIEDKVKDNRRITVLDELTLIFATLSVKDSEMEKIVKRVCCILMK